MDFGMMQYIEKGGQCSLFINSFFDEIFDGVVYDIRYVWCDCMLSLGLRNDGYIGN